jgi:hypothetical protein
MDAEGATSSGDGDPGPSLQGKVRDQESDEKIEQKGPGPQTEREGNIVWSEDETQSLPWSRPWPGGNMNTTTLMRSCLSLRR